METCVQGLGGHGRGGQYGWGAWRRLWEGGMEAGRRAAGTEEGAAPGGTEGEGAGWRRPGL